MNHLFLRRPFTVLSIFLSIPLGIDAAPARPNILFAISDDQSWPHAGAYGTGWVKTPGFDRVAKEGHVLIGKERHDTGRPNDLGFPIRGIVKDGWLYLENFETDRWPSGDPITGYLNCDGSPTKSLILDLRRSGEDASFWKLNFGKRPDVEFYHAAEDPACINNLAKITDHTDRMDAMKKQMEYKLQAQSDPRIKGEGAIFDRYPVASGSAKYYERMMKEGKAPNAGWVNKGDYEKENPKDERP